jgi:chromosome segregation ATPase
MALGIVSGDLDSTAKAFANLIAELEREKATQETTQTEVDTMTQAVKDLKISTKKFTAQICNLEEKVKHLEVIDRLNEVRARELCLERTNKANDDYHKQNAQLTKKLESKFTWSFTALYCS